MWRSWGLVPADLEDELGNCMCEGIEWWRMEAFVYAAERVRGESRGGEWTKSKAGWYYDSRGSQRCGPL